MNIREVSNNHRLLPTFIFMKYVFLLCTLLLSPGSRGQNNRLLTRVAFGSCSKEDSTQLWAEVVKQKPQLWIWLGDNIYGDTHDMKLMRSKYDHQNGNTREGRSDVGHTG